MPDRVSFPRVFQAHRTEAYGTPGWNALDVLAYVLTDGESARLPRVLVRERQLVQDVDSYLLPTQLEGVFGWVATARSGVEPEAIEEAVREQIERVARDGVEEDELAGAVRRIRRDQIAALATVEERAEALAHADTVLGEAAALNRVMDGYLDVDREAVAEAARRLLAGGGASLWVVPNGEVADDEE